MPADRPRSPEHIVWKKKAPRPRPEGGGPPRFAHQTQFLVVAGLIVVVFGAWIARPRGKQSGSLAAKGVRPIALPEGSRAIALAAGREGLWVALEGPAAFLHLSYKAPHAVLARVDLDVPNPNLKGLAVGPDGSVWATLEAASKLVKLEANWPHAVTVFDVPQKRALPGHITAGSDGAMWFAQQGIPRLGRIGSSRPHDLTEMLLPGTGKLPYANRAMYGIASAPDGLLWFTRELRRELCSYRPGALEEIRCRALALPRGTLPRDVAITPDGRVFFTLSTLHVGVWEPATGLRVLPVPTTIGGAVALTASASGFVYVTGLREIFQIEARDPGNIEALTLPAPFFNPSALAVAPDGAVYFVDGSGVTIGRFEPRGMKPPG